MVLQLTPYISVESDQKENTLTTLNHYIKTSFKINQKLSSVTNLSPIRNIDSEITCCLTLYLVKD